MDDLYAVGFKDVYPWVWSVMLGVALTLAERRGAFLPAGARTPTQYWTKDIVAVIVTLVVPSVVFGITMTCLGPLYSPNMDFWQILGALYLAGVPLGTLHLWLVIAMKCGWMPATTLQEQEVRAIRMIPRGS